MKNADMPAIPVDINSCNSSGFPSANTSGCSKREEFSKSIIVSLIQNPNLLSDICPDGGFRDVDAEQIAAMAVDIADALLAELERTK